MKILVDIISHVNSNSYSELLEDLKEYDVEVVETIKQYDPSLTRQGYQLNIDKERSVDVIITRLRKKIEIDPKNPKFLQTLRGSGYVLWID